MQQYFMQYKNWYETRQTRERFLIILLVWALLYAIFSFSLFNPISYQQKSLINDIKITNDQIKNWNMQIDALNQISHSPLYKQWLDQHQALSSLQSQYTYLMNATYANQWHQVIKIILQKENNITIVQIKDFPETPYSSINLSGTKPTIYQQKLSLIIYSNYFDTIAYLQRLEKSLPTIHWDSLNYQVVQYPIGKVEMELSIFYEKTRG